ncbi:MAG: Copper-binding protein [Candidatus Nitrosotenuis sp.]|nr:Copper-binding protein [Candidatus Nitrosotenuis sp.]
MLPAFADQFQSPTDKGTLLVSISTEPTKPLLGDLTKLKIDFINPKTNKIQQHIDYKVTVTKDGTPVFGPIPLTHTSEGAVTIPVEFKENGEHKISVDIEGILFQPIPPETVTFTEVIGDASAQTSPGTDGDSKKIGSCIIATAAFGSELAPQVQLLREVRDNVLFSTSSGTSFMSAFNAFYYSFSPTVADLERQSPIFKETVKMAITPMLSTLYCTSHNNIKNTKF